MSKFPNITFTNKLGYDVVFYDAFEPDAAAKLSPTAYFGVLTPLSTVKPGASAAVAPIHGPISTYLAYDGAGNPIARGFTMGSPGAPATFAVGPADVARITSTGHFIDAITAQPKAQLATSFKALLTAPGAPAAVNKFFAANAPYQDCTFVSYMMVAAARARNPGQPVAGATYSLARLCDMLGGEWPSIFPDIAISEFTCSESNDTLQLGGIVDVRTLKFAPGVNEFIMAILPNPAKVRASFSFHYGFDAGVFGTRIEFHLDTLTLVPGVTLKAPTISIDINPLFQFAVFTARTVVPFSMFGSPTFNADLSATIDNVEASVGLVIDGNGHTLFTPPVMKGVHFDQFGAGMGVCFEPPGYALGLQGKFHIGDGSIALTDDTFVVVCTFNEEEVPNPVYISFYVPRMTADEIITIFTNSSAKFDFPISFNDLSFRWAEDPMNPVILPDGTLAPMGYGFSANLQVMGMSFYGAVEIDLTHGVSGELTMAPLSAGPLKIAGDGKGVSVKVDAHGNPIPNNQVATTNAMREAIAKAPSKELVAAGGPALTVSTSSSPYLTLGASVSLFELVNESIHATVASSGIEFELDYGAVLQAKMRCALQDFHNFKGDFSYGLDMHIPLPTIAGFSLGSIPLEATCNASLGIATSSSDIVMSVGGGFDFEGLTLNIGPFSADLHIAKISDLIESIGQYLLDHVEEIFGDFIKDAGKWAKLVYQGIITGIDDVAQGLKTAFGKTEQEVAQIMSDAGYNIEQAAIAIKNAFSAGATDVANALKSAYNTTAAGVASVLKDAGYAITDISRALSDAFGAVPGVVNSILQGLGYGADEIKDAFESLGGDFASFAESVWQTITHVLNPGNW
jgi:hypothetical protein